MERILRRNYRNGDLRELAARLGVTYHSVMSKAEKLGLRRKRWEDAKRWKKREIDKLTKLYPDTPNAELAEMFGCKVFCVNAVAGRLNLKKSKEFLALSGKRVSALQSSIDTRFKKGRTSFNKGKAQTEFMSEEGLRNSMRTRFKKGHVPAGTLPLGEKRRHRDGYWYIKTEHGMELLHKVVWEQHHGKVPEGMCIAFADWDRDNCDISNLILISCAERMRRVVKSLTPEQRKSAVQKAAVKRMEGIRRDRLRVKWCLEPVGNIVKGYGGLTR